MAWYRTGTISLTNGSTAVTGSGTAWISNAAVGEALLAPDGKLYEIANIASDTSITLGSSYLGTTQSGQAYVIVPSQSYIRDLAAQASALVNNYSTFYNTVGQGKFPDGAVATPAISFSNDTNTGLYRSAADEVTLVANGVAIAKWNTSGFSFVSGVSTITANSASPALKITQTGTGNALVVEDVASDTTPFVIDQNGKVIVGATSSINQSTGPANVQSTALVSFGGFNTNADTTPAIVELSKSRAGAVVLSGDQVGQLRFSAFDSAGYMRTAQITSEVDGTPGTSDMPGRLVFSTTADGAATPTERLRIDSSGNVLVKSAAGLGYGTGAGGQVTQVTSKSTPVTLNTPCGQITMNNAALAAGAEVGFGFNNSVMTNADVLIVAPQGVFGTAYSTRVVIGTAGASIYVKNMTAGSLSDAVVLNFVVIKGAVA